MFYLQGEFVKLACTQHGAFSVIAIWDNSGTRWRRKMSLELSAEEAVLNSNQFGKLVFDHCSLSTFLRDETAARKGNRARYDEEELTSSENDEEEEDDDDELSSSDNDVHPEEDNLCSEDRDTSGGDKHGGGENE